MTHSLHRRGHPENLKGDFVFLCTPAKGVNTSGAGKKLKNILRILMESDVANIGFYGIGSLADEWDEEVIAASIDEYSRLRCCFDRKEALRTVLQEIKAGDFGLSVVVSGLIPEVLDMARELGLVPHTINLSCGVFGNTSLLPGQPVLELTTMCGHGLISHRLAAAVIRKIRAGSLDVGAGVEILRKPCTCGIFNPTRAGAILSEQKRSG